MPEAVAVYLYSVSGVRPVTVTGEDSPPERPGPETTVVVHSGVAEGVQLTVTVLCVLERLKPGSAQMGRRLVVTSFVTGEGVNPVPEAVAV